MKGTDNFKATILAYLQGVAQDDPLFAETLKKPEKDIDGCVTYILNQVKASGCNGFEDSEIYGMAVHYYDEDDIKPGSAITCQVVVNHTVELTEADIAQAKQEAIDKVIREEMNRIKKKPEVAKKEQKVFVQQSLF